jgi:Fe-S-cluster containining protein
MLDSGQETAINKYEKLLERSKAKHKEILRKMKHLSKLSKTGFDALVHRYHDEVFAEVDCTECGLCCSNLGPVFRNTDIKHICAAIGSSEREFMEKYLMQDPDGVGFMLRELPCPFQESDNKCGIYDVRTLSCVNFPHTQSVNFQKKLVGLALDSQFCPAAFLICEKIIENYN